MRRVKVFGEVVKCAPSDRGVTTKDPKVVHVAGMNVPLSHQEQIDISEAGFREHD